MKLKPFLKTILIYIIYLVIFISSITITAGIAAYITSLITEDIETIVTTCLVSIWIVAIIIYIIRSKWFYKKKTDSMVNDDTSKIPNEKNLLKIRYIITAIIYSVIFGYILFKLKPSILNNIYGQEDTNQEMFENDTMILVLKISFLVVLVSFWVYKVLRKRKIKIDNKKNENNSFITKIKLL